MGLAFLEILIEPLAEIAFWFLSAVFGLAVAELGYSLWVATRWLIVSDRRAEPFQDAEGATWGIRVTWRPWPSEWPVSSRMFGLRGHRPGAAGRSREHWLHPSRMVERFDEALFFVAPVVVALIVILVAVFIIETVVVIFIVAVAAAWRFVSRRSWRVVMTSPEGSVETRGGLTVRDAIELAAQLQARAISSGPLNLRAAMRRKP